MKLRIGQPEYGGTFTTLAVSPDENRAAPERFVLPGEFVDPATESAGLTILEASPDRVEPRCQHFGVCGGCDYQHATYPTQLALKQVILHGILSDANLTPLPAAQVHSTEPWQYRNRIRVRIERVNGVFHFGYNRRGTREFLPVVECPIAGPLLLHAATVLVGHSATDPAIAAWMPSIAEAEFYTNGNVVQVTLFTRDRRSHGFAAFCEALHRHLPELVGAGTLAASAGYGAKERSVWGTGGLAHRVLDRTYWVSRGGFFQVNRFLINKMVELATDGRTGRLAWDLFAGVGLFSRVLATSFAEVVAVESSAVSSADLAVAAKANRMNMMRAVHGDVAEFLRGAVVQRERPDLIVMDPPRAGLGREVCDLLGRIGAPSLVYISCDPNTLARDLEMLVHSGYCLTEVHLLDMFPQTFHLETIVFLQK